MDSKGYFKYLSELLTESAASAAIDIEVPKAQANLYNGAGLEDPGLNKEPGIGNLQPEVDEEEIDQNIDDLGDASYMNASEPSLETVSEERKKTKLFELFQELTELCNYVHESFSERISVDLLDKEQNSVLNITLDKTDEIKKKVEEYSINTYSLRTYEESLYIYILLRSELLITIKLLRKTLKLNRQTDATQI